MKSGKCPKCKSANVSRCRSAAVQAAPGGGYYDNAVETEIYGCNDCHYTETYLSDEKYRQPLEGYERWERVSAMASGPFR